MIVSDFVNKTVYLELGDSKGVFLRSFPLSERLPVVNSAKNILTYVPWQFTRSYIDGSGIFDRYLRKCSSKSRSTLDWGRSRDCAYWRIFWCSSIWVWCLATALLLYSQGQMAEHSFSRCYARIWHSNRPSLRVFSKMGWAGVALVFQPRFLALLPLRVTFPATGLPRVGSALGGSISADVGR